MGKSLGGPAPSKVREVVGKLLPQGGTHTHTHIYIHIILYIYTPISSPSSVSGVLGAKLLMNVRGSV